MSKDKGDKNHKKPKADKNDGKKKGVSAYKSEGKGIKTPDLDVFTTNRDDKTGGGHKKKK